MKRVGKDSELIVQASVELNESNINSLGLVINPLATINEECEELLIDQQGIINSEEMKDSNSNQGLIAINDEHDLLIENMEQEYIEGNTQIELKSLRKDHIDEPGYISYEEAKNDDILNGYAANLKHSYSQPNLQERLNEVVGSLKRFVSWTVDRVNSINSTGEIKEEINKACEYVEEIAASSPKQLLAAYENFVGSDKDDKAQSDTIKTKEAFYGDLVDIKTIPYVNGEIKENQLLVDGTVIETNDLSSHSPSDDICKTIENEQIEQGVAENIKLKRRNTP